MHKSRDRPRSRQRLLARVRPDRVRYASGAPVTDVHSQFWHICQLQTDGTYPCSSGCGWRKLSVTLGDIYKIHLPRCFWICVGGLLQDLFGDGKVVAILTLPENERMLQGILGSVSLEPASRRCVAPGARMSLLPQREAGIIPPTFVTYRSPHVTKRSPHVTNRAPHVTNLSPIQLNGHH